MTKIVKAPKCPVCKKPMKLIKTPKGKPFAWSCKCLGY
jgi:hypothetical protein